MKRLSMETNQNFSQNYEHIPSSCFGKCTKFTEVSREFTNPYTASLAFAFVKLVIRHFGQFVNDGDVGICEDSSDNRRYCLEFRLYNFIWVRITVHENF